MAIDTENKRRSVLQCVPGLNTYPVADGVLSVGDREQASWVYSGLPPIISKVIGGTLTSAGALSRVTTRYRIYGGTLTPSATLNVLVTPLPFPGGLTLAGGLVPTPTYVIGLSGELIPIGAISAGNPAWLLIDDTLRWMGEWDIAVSYDIDDAVLYKASSDVEWHVFVSKVGHNVGNNPDSTAEWRRLYQEKWL